MTQFQVKFYKGTYKTRQLAANDNDAICYVEHHFNAAGSSNANYAVCVVGSNSSSTSRNMARHYVREVATAFRVPIGGQQGLLIGGYNGRGNHNVRFTKMPAMLLEPLFVSNPESARLVKSESGQTQLAQILAETIVEFFPAGGLVAFSVGHKYKPRPQHNDRGASVYGGGTEAEYAEIVLEKTKSILESIDEHKAPVPAVHTVRAGETLWSIARLYQISLDRIFALNPGISADIRPRQEINV